jgi:site-specific DNA recombinase
LTDAGLHIRIAWKRLAELLGARSASDEPLLLTVDGCFRNRKGLRLASKDGVPLEPASIESLPRLISRARVWWRELRDGRIDITTLAAREQRSPSYVTRVVRLAFLAPNVVEAVLAGEQRSEVSATMLTLQHQLSANWAVQEAALLPAR